MKKGKKQVVIGVAEDIVSSIDSDKISITPIIYDLTDKSILDDINNKWV